RIRRQLLSPISHGDGGAAVSHEHRQSARSGRHRRERWVFRRADLRRLAGGGTDAGLRRSSVAQASAGVRAARVVGCRRFSLSGSLSDRGRKRWTTLVLALAAGLVALLPRVPARWTVPIFIVYGFFFMSSYPMTEAALMESVPDAVRGRVFGLFITVGGLLGN